MLVISTAGTQTYVIITDAPVALDGSLGRQQSILMNGKDNLPFALA